MKNTKIATLLLLVIALMISAQAVLGADLEFLTSTSMNVKINGQSSTATGTAADPINVSPGDHVEINFGFINNYAKTLGHVQASATFSNPAFPTITGTCDSTNCNNGYWVLRPTETGAGQFVLDIPGDVAPAVTTFTSTLDLFYDNFWAPGYVVTTVPQTLNFAVVRDQANFVIESAILSESALSCTSTTSLTLQLLNQGQISLGPEVLIFDQQPVESSFDPVRGQFRTFSVTPKISIKRQLNTLTAGSRDTQIFAIDTKDLSLGGQRLFIYLVNPYFYTTAHPSYIGDMEQVSLTKSNCVAGFIPAENTMTLALGTTKTFSVTINQAGFNPNNVAWYLDNVIQANGLNWNKLFDTAGTYNVKVTVNDGSTTLPSKTWQVTVPNGPTSTSLTTNIPAGVTQAQLAAFDGFTVSNAAGQIIFDSVDLTGITNLDNVITISNNGIAVDTVNAIGLQGRATLTILGTFTNPIIMRSSGYNGGTFSICPAATCTPVSNSNGRYVFTVNSFSTYKVAEAQPAAVEVSNILFDNANRGEQVTTSIVVKNIGTTQSLTGVKVELIGVGTKYTPVLTSTVPAILTGTANLGPGEQATLTLQVKVPSDEDAGSHSIGTLKVTGTDGNNVVQTKLQTIYLNPKSFLTIESIKINGKTSGDLTIKELNEIEVNIQNDYTEDMTDVTVTATILDVDGEDVEETSESFDLNDGQDKKVTLEFDLSSENLDEEQYTIEITVEGSADDNTDHKTVQTVIANLDLLSHEIIVKKTILTVNPVQCSKQSSLEITVENTGENDEDDIEITATNSALNINKRWTDISINNFLDGDNEHSVSLNLDLEGIAVGTYPLTVQVLRDGTLEDTTEVTLTVQACGVTGTSSTASQTVVQKANDDLAKQLQQYVQAKAQQTGASTVKASFRESTLYLALLSVLGILVLVAIVMGMAVLIVKKK